MTGQGLLGVTAETVMVRMHVPTGWCAVQVLRYSEGQTYRQHMDGMGRMATMLIYLTGAPRVHACAACMLCCTAALSNATVSLPCILPPTATHAAFCPLSAHAGDGANAPCTPLAIDDRLVFRRAGSCPLTAPRDVTRAANAALRPHVASRCLRACNGNGWPSDAAAACLRHACVFGECPRGDVWWHLPALVCPCQIGYCRQLRSRAAGQVDASHNTTKAPPAAHAAPDRPPNHGRRFTSSSALLWCPCSQCACSHEASTSLARSTPAACLQTPPTEARRRSPTRPTATGLTRRSSRQA